MENVGDCEHNGLGQELGTETLRRFSRNRGVKRGVRYTCFKSLKVLSDVEDAS